MKFFKEYAHFESTNQIPRSIDNSIIIDIRWAIFLVDSYVPWENVCRHQAYQAMILFLWFKVPYQIFVGFKNGEDGKINGHAWTMANGEMITGFCNPEEYIVQQVFS